MRESRPLAMQAALAIALLSMGASGQAPSSADVALEQALARVRQDAARYAHATYSACTDAARKLSRSIETFLEEPSPGSLEAARRSWLAGRETFGRSEVLRFSQGPIDDRLIGVETYLNAWPLDEAYIDAVEGQPRSGIVFDTTNYPNLSETILVIANERGGEANVAIGWHAIEFMLWGQDLDADGPGQRSYRDFVVGGAAGAERRREYLRLIARLLVMHHEQVQQQWAADRADNYRAQFEQLAPLEAARRVLTGMVILSGFEMSGERLAVAFETRDQEDEHSCFSDNTHRDFINDQAGIVGLYRGTGLGMQGHGLTEVARIVAPAAAEEMDRLMERATKALTALPVPFDRLLKAADGSAERACHEAAIDALDAQAEALAALALELGFEVPMNPGN